MPTRNDAVQIPRGLADPQGEIIYVVDLQGLIHQLDLQNGTSLARTPYAGQPLALYQGSLIGWGRTGGAPPGLHLFSVVRAGSSLEPTWETQLELPGWVELDSPEAGRFSIEGQINNDELTITWQANIQYTGGAPPTAEVADAEARSERRLLQIDPATGAVLSDAQLEPVPEQVPALPALPAGTFFLPYLRAGVWATQPWQVEAQELYLVREAAQPGVLLVRRDLDGASGEQRTRLTEDPGAEAAISPDGRWIFLHEPSTAGPAWGVFAAPAGELFARLPFDAGTEDVAVLDDRVLYLVVEPTGSARQFSLRCRDLQTGETKWLFPLGEETTQAPPALQP